MTTIRSGIDRAVPVHARAGRAGLGPSAVLTLLCVAQFMVVLDVSIVNVALPSIRHALGFSQTALQWVVNAYVLAFAGFLLLGGRLGDLFGRRRLFIIGLGCFTFSSLLCGAAHDESVMIGARAAQGLSAALLAPATLNILTTTFTEGAQRTRAMGLWSAMAAAGGVVGSIVGGVVTQALSWRWIFLINVPIGLLALAAASAVLPPDLPMDGRRRPDVVGALIGTSGLVLLVYGITQSGTYGWRAPRVIAPIAIGIAKLCAFVVIEWRVAKHPLMPLSLFSKRSLRAANVAVLLVSSVMFAAWFFMTLYLQNVLGYDALKAGLAFLPSGFAVIAGTQISARLIRRTGSRPLLILAPLTISAGMLWFAQLPVQGSYAANVVGPSVVTMLGFGMAFVPLTMSAMSGVSPDLAGIASGVFNTSRQVGGAIGLAVLATIAVDRTKTVLAGGHATHAALLGAMSQGYTRAFLVGAIVAACAAPIAALAAPARIRSSRWWHHAICAAAGQPWRCEQPEQPAP
jgi:EmrB/QacA subfamily drug resistance transporter